jgi:hypothetical protein
MCYLIHIGVPTAHAESIESQRVPRIAPQQNASVAAAFGPSFVLFSVSDGGCACNLYSSPDAGHDAQDRKDTKRRKYERMGWSAAKITRALAASDDAHAQSGRRIAGLRDDVVAIVANLAATAGEVRLLVHHYHGMFAEERVVPRGTRHIGASELRRGDPAAISEDIVYVIR